VFPDPCTVAVCAAQPEGATIVVAVGRTAIAATIRAPCVVPAGTSIRNPSSGRSAIVRKAFSELVTVAVVLPDQPALAHAPSQTPKPPPLFNAVPASDCSPVLLKLAFVQALKAAAAESLSRATM